MRFGYRAAFRGIQVWTFLRRPSVRGTMIVVLDGEAPRRVLLVRHTYGDPDRWELPGGWVHAQEAAEVAAQREALEELGIAVDFDGPSGVLYGLWDFKQEELSWFACSWPGGRGTYDPVEIAEVAWFSLDALPERLGPAAREVLRRVVSASAS